MDETQTLRYPIIEALRIKGHLHPSELWQGQASRQNQLLWAPLQSLYYVLGCMELCTQGLWVLLLMAFGFSLVTESTF